jgi:hypothetical protein
MRLFTGMERELQKRKPGRPYRVDGHDPIVGARIPKRLIRALKDRAAQNEMSITEVLRQAVAQYVANEGEAA